MEIRLRDVIEDDLPIFFEQQLDPAANHMAAFTAKEPADRDAFMTRWAKILNNKSIIIKTILYNNQVAGHVLSYASGDTEPDMLEVSYWLGREFWGKGIATQALAAFLPHIRTRPLYARAVKDNIGSIRVLEKCGFTITGEDAGFSNARGEEVEEYILKLEEDP
jgi:RimJ/RimL family protein N-acetyltransferase